MQGFFNKSQLKSRHRPDGKNYSCISCGLYKGVNSPKMEPYGNFKKHIMIIGEAPGKIEDERGKPWQGKMGRLLKRTLAKFDIDLFEDCISLNAVNCHPEDNREPKGMEINCCRIVKVLPALADYNPDIIIPLGGAAVSSLLDLRWKEALGGITKWRGWTIPDQEYRCWICPTYHPSYVHRMQKEQNNKVARILWEQDIKRAVELAGVQRRRYPKPNIHYIEDLSQLEEITGGTVAIDYETTGLKPHASGHRIVCGSVAYDENNAYVFPIPRRKKDRQPLVRLLEDPNVDKIAHNIKFEDHWSKIRLGAEVRGWLYDPMNGAHVLDNRYGIISLKFQAYVLLGVLGYDSEVTGYLKSADKKNANSFNSIYDLIKQPEGMKKLLYYCGLDSIYTYRIAFLQMDELEYDYLPF